MTLLLVVAAGMNVFAQPAGASESDQAAEPIVERNLPSVAALYEWAVIGMGTTPQKQSWDYYFWRKPGYVEIRDDLRRTTDVWRVTTNKQLFYEQVFHDEKHIVEFNHADLAMVHRNIDWNRMETMIDFEGMKPYFQHVGEKHVDAIDRTCQVYHGKFPHAEVELYWLKEEVLPAMMKEIYEDHITVLVLKEIHAYDESPWEHGEFDDYIRGEFADLDDLDTDPFFQNYIGKQTSSPEDGVE